MPYSCTLFFYLFSCLAGVLLPLPVLGLKCGGEGCYGLTGGGVWIDSPQSALFTCAVYFLLQGTFKLFAGFVLLLIGGRMLWENILRPLCCRLGLHRDVCREAQPRITPVEVVRFDWRRLEFRFSDKVYGVSVPTLILLTTVVGMLGGAYGVGGGAIISPFLVTFLQLPVYTVAGASLLGTFLTSAFAVVLFTVLAPLLGSASLTVSPDWMLGGLFGLGGLLGTYLGASLQRYLPQQAIKIVLALGVTVVSTRYIVGYFL